jgi:hypothetical protein
VTPTGGEHARETRRGRSVSPLVVVLVVGVATLLVAAGLLLTRSAPRRSDSNGAADDGLAVTIQPGQQLCQPGELIPADTAAIRLDAGAPAAVRGPALGAEVQNLPGSHAAGTLAAGWRRGPVSIPLAPTVRHDAVATVCVRDLGPGAASFGGSVPAGSWVLSIDGRGLGGRVRIDYLRPGSESWLSLLPALAHRVTLGKSRLVRHWAPAALILLMLLAVALGLYTVLASGARA